MEPSPLNLRPALAALAAAALMSTSAEAAQIFRQTFTNGLGANESVGGRFAVKDGQAGNVNGSRNYDYSWYQLVLDLTDYTDATMTFDYDILSEYRFDGFNVVASTGQVDPPNGLLMPTTPGFYGPMGNSLSKLGPTALSGDRRGSVAFDLTQFAGQAVTLRFQYQSDYFAFNRGILFDNILVTGTRAAGAVPEPATWAMLLIGFFGSGALLRQSRRRYALTGH